MIRGPDGGLLVGIAEEEVERADDGHKADLCGMALRLKLFVRLDAVVGDTRCQAHEKGFQRRVDAKTSPIGRKTIAR